MSAAIIPFPVKRSIDKTAIALHALSRLQGKLDSRPVEGGLTLGTPACARRCAVCYLECAIIPERIDWWEGELESIGGLKPHMLRKDGAQ